MKKAYVTPEAKLFDICMEEKIATGCYSVTVMNFASGAGSCIDVAMGDNVGKSLGNGCVERLQNS